MVIKFFLTFFNWLLYKTNIYNLFNIALLIMNHAYETDWLFGWMFCEKVGVLGNCKAYAKKVISYIPTIGLLLFNTSMSIFAHYTLIYLIAIQDGRGNLLSLYFWRGRLIRIEKLLQSSLMKSSTIQTLCGKLFLCCLLD